MVTRVHSRLNPLLPESATSSHLLMGVTRTRLPNPVTRTRLPNPDGCHPARVFALRGLV